MMRYCKLKSFEKAGVDLLRYLVCMVVVVCLVGCADPQTKKARFYEKGVKLYNQEELVQARLEFKNALQIDAKYVDAWYMLGLIELRQQNFQQAYACMLKAHELKPQDQRVMLELAKLYLKGGAPDRALAMADKLVQLDKANVKALLVRSVALDSLGRTAESLEILNDFKAKGEKDADVYLLLAAHQAQNGDVAAARGTLEDGLRLNPSSEPILVTLANLYMQLKQTDKAEAALKTTIKLNPKSLTYRLNLAGLYWQTGRQAQARNLLAQDQPKLGTDDILQLTAFYLKVDDVAAARACLTAASKREPKNTRLKLALSEIMLGQGQLAEAEQTLRAVADRTGADKLEALSRLAVISLSRGKVKQAEEYVAELLKADPASDKGHMLKGRILLAKADAAGAVAEFRTVISHNPTEVDARVMLAQAHLAAGQNGLAMDALNEAVTQNPDNAEALLARARLLAGQTKYGEAGDDIARVLTKNPANYAARCLKADLQLARGDKAAAKALYRELIAAAPRDESNYRKLGRVLFADGASGEALKLLDSGFKQNPDSEGLFADLVQVQMATGQAAQAEALCRARSGRGDAPASLLLAEVLRSKRDLAGSEQALNLAVRQAPTWSRPYELLAGLYLAKGQPQQALVKLRSGIAANPRSLDLCLALGSLQEQRGDNAQARSTYEQGLKSNPNSWQLLNNLAFLLVAESDKKSDWNKAAELAERARVLVPKEAAVLDTLGWLSYRRGDLAGAKLNLDKAIAASPKDPEINYHVACLLKDSGKRQEAHVKLQTALASGRGFHGRKQAEVLLKQL